MRCNKCGSYVEKGQVTCPLCGAVVDVSDPVEQIQSEIGSKIDMFLSDKVENLKGVDDGVNMENGSMGLTSHHITDDEEYIVDSVFSNETLRSVKADTIQNQISREERIRKERQEEERQKEEIIREERLRLERLRKERAMEREAYVASQRKPQDGGREDKKKGGNVGIIIAIIAAVIVIAVIVILLVSGLAEKTEQVASETTTEATSEVLDVITCNLNDGGTYAVPVKVTLESLNGNRIYYTLDGKTPSVSSNKYLGEIAFEADKVTGESTSYTLRAVTYTNSSLLAGEIKVTFTLINPEVNAPQISPASGDYSTVQQISVYSDEGTTVYYTYDGTTPTTDSPVYTGPVTMLRGNNIFSALAEKNGNFSTVSSAVYNLDIPAAIDYNQALQALKDWLKSEKQIDPDATSPSGEKAILSSSGTTVIGQDQYYVITCEIFDKSGQLQASQTFGVHDQNGGVVALSKEGFSYSIIG